MARANPWANFFLGLVDGVITVDVRGSLAPDRGMVRKRPQPVAKSLDEQHEADRRLRPRLMDLVDGDRRQLRAVLDDVLTGRMNVLVEVPVGTELEWGGLTGRDENGAPYSPREGEEEDHPPDWAWEVVHSRRPTMARCWLRLLKGDVRRLRDGLAKATEGGKRPGLLHDVAVELTQGGSFDKGHRLARLAEPLLAALARLCVEGATWIHYSVAIGLAGSTEDARGDVQRACGLKADSSPGDREVRNLERTIGALALALADAQPVDFRHDKDRLPKQRPIAAAVATAMDERGLATTGLSESAVRGRIRDGLDRMGVIEDDADSR